MSNAEYGQGECPVAISATKLGPKRANYAIGDTSMPDKDDIEKYLLSYFS
jgi:hypothetical protein